MLLGIGINSEPMATCLGFFDEVLQATVGAVYRLIMRVWTGLFFSSLASAAFLGTNLGSLDKRAACPGYKASNVKTTGSSLTADLKLAGSACNVYGKDLTHLTLEVTYEDGKMMWQSIDGNAH